MKALRALCLCLCFISFASAFAQDGQGRWFSVPTVPLAANDPDLIGAAVLAIAKRGERESRARVVVSVARKWGTALIGVSVNDLPKLVSEKELWPYTGPDPGPEAMNSRMMEFTLVSPRGEAHFHSQMLMSSSGNFAKGVADDGDELFGTNCKMDKRFIAFLAEMKAGFDYGVIRIGQGVFSPPIEIKFGGRDATTRLTPVMEYVRESR